MVHVLMDSDKLVEYGIPTKYIDILRNRGITVLNPIQEEAIRRGLLKGKNLVVTAPTASGKTLIGELAMVKAIDNGMVAVYLTPLKALANEKYREFRELDKIGVRVGITTGDYDRKGEELSDYNLIVATYERFDSLLRLKPSWISRVGCVVVDELHLLMDPERGPVIEMIIARLLKQNVHLVGLSATIGNPEILAKWIRGEIIVSDWRPVKLVEGYYNRDRGEIVFMDGRVEKVTYRVGDSLLNIVLHNLSRDIQTLVFIHNRKKVEEYAEKTLDFINGSIQHLPFEIIDRLSESPSRIERERLSKLLLKGVAFHHAGLSSVARSVVEEAFLKRAVKVVYATPTLALGVNLPARRVLVSVKRYDPSYGTYRFIPVFEYKQMAGRAGRPRFDQFGEAIVYDTDPSNAYNYVKGKVEPIFSYLGGERSLRINVLSLIASGEASNINEIIDIFRNTLYYSLSMDRIWISSAITRTVKNLIDWNMVETRGSELIATKLGRITSYTYLDPLSVVRYFKLLRRNPDIFYFLYLITLTPDYNRSKPYVPSKIIDDYEDEAYQYIGSIGLSDEIEKGELDEYLVLQSYVHAKLLYDWINEVDEDTIMSKYGVGPGDIYSISETSSWISYALSRVEEVVGGRDRSVLLDKLSTRLKYGVREDALELVKLEGIGRVRARILISNGIKTLEELAKTPINKLMSLPTFGRRIVEKIIEQLIEYGFRK